MASKIPAVLFSVALLGFGSLPVSGQVPNPAVVCQQNPLPTALVLNFDHRDVDQDGYSDCLEVHLGTNLNGRDTDGDGVWDSNDLQPQSANVPKIVAQLAHITEVTTECDDNGIGNKQYFDPYIGTAYAKLPIQGQSTTIKHFPRTGFTGPNPNTGHGHNDRSYPLVAQEVTLDGSSGQAEWGATDAFGLPALIVTLGWMDHDGNSANDEIDVGAKDVNLPAYLGTNGQAITTLLLGSHPECSACIGIEVDSPIKLQDAMAAKLPAVSVPNGAAMVTWEQTNRALQAWSPPPADPACGVEASSHVEDDVMNQLNVDPFTGDSVFTHFVCLTPDCAVETVVETAEHASETVGDVSDSLTIQRIPVSGGYGNFLALGQAVYTIPSGSGLSGSTSNLMMGTLQASYGGSTFFSESVRWRDHAGTIADAFHSLVPVDVCIECLAGAGATSVTIDLHIVVTATSGSTTTELFQKDFSVPVSSTGEWPFYGLQLSDDLGDAALYTSWGVGGDVTTI